MKKKQRNKRSRQQRSPSPPPTKVAAAAIREIKVTKKKKNSSADTHTDDEEGDVDRPTTGGQIGHRLVKVLAGIASSCRDESTTTPTNQNEYYDHPYERHNLRPTYDHRPTTRATTTSSSRGKCPTTGGMTTSQPLLLLLDISMVVYNLHNKRLF